MSTFKVQRIRSCVQCGVVLGLKCKACVAHPTRKPKIVEVYDWPPILETCPSGDCLRIACQRPGCKKTMWRNRTHTRGGKMKYATMYCSQECNIAELARARDTRVEVPCGWHACNTKVRRSASQLKNFKRAFCRPDHYWLALKKDAHDAKQAEHRASEGEDGLSMMQCEGKCRGEITEHKQTAKHRAECLICRWERNSRIAIPA